MEKMNKKMVIKFSLGIILLVVLVVGATFAYFTMNNSIDSSPTNLNAELDEVGNVALISGDNLNLEISQYDMKNKDKDVSYYASKNGKVLTETEEVIAYTSVVGNGLFDCSYTLTVTDKGTNSIYNAFQNMSGKSENQIVLTINGEDYDFNTDNLFPLAINGTLNSVSETMVQEIKAKLKLVNKTNIDQSALAGTDIYLDFGIDKFECKPVKEINLASVVKESAREYKIAEGNFNNATKLKQNDYKNISMSYYGYAYDDETYEDVEIDEKINSEIIFNDNNSWSFNFGEVIKPALDRYSSWYESPHINFVFNLSGSEYKRLCYNTEELSTYIQIFVDDDFYTLNNENGTACMDIGFTNSDNNIKVEFRNVNVYDSESADFDVNFYVETTNNLAFEETHYRYVGSNINNYIEFNNELWRIIGIIPTCTSSGCKTKENLIKIIRNEPIGQLKFDSSTNIWGNNILYKLLNEYYYGASNATETIYCSNNACDYTNIGIKHNNNYNKMMKNVYWNTGVVQGELPRETYFEEIKKQDVTGYIGLVSVSDIEFVGTNNDNWLYNVGWTNTGYSGYEYYAYFSSGTYTSIDAVSLAKLVRPVVYLNKDVLKTGGDGTEQNPYKIAM